MHHSSQNAAATEWSAVTGISKQEETAVRFIVTEPDGMAHFQHLLRVMHTHRNSSCGYVSRLEGGAPRVWSSVHRMTETRQEEPLLLLHRSFTRKPAASAADAPSVFFRFDARAESVSQEASHYRLALEANSSCTPCVMASTWWLEREVEELPARDLQYRYQPKAREQWSELFVSTLWSYGREERIITMEQDTPYYVPAGSR